MLVRLLGPTGSPFINTVPSVGFCNPAIYLNKVDLPHPEGPRIMANCPCAGLSVITKSRSLRTTILPSS
jgi:hypothetical protein